MTSVLYGSGLNYQIGNPVRTEINKVNALVSELRKVVDAQGTELIYLRGRISTLEKAANITPPPAPGGGGGGGGGGAR